MSDTNNMSAEQAAAFADEYTGRPDSDEAESMADDLDTDERTAGDMTAEQRGGPELLPPNGP